MNSSPPENANLSDIPTVWPDIHQANEDGPAAREAQERIVVRYGPAVLRYLFVLVKDVETASDLFQQFAKGLVEGRMRRADPARGKFRSYLKTTLVNLFLDHRRRQKQLRERYVAEVPELCEDLPSIHESDQEFLTIWRNELLKSAFDELEIQEKRTGRPYYTILDLRLRHAEARTLHLAELYAAQTGTSVTVDRMRRLLFEARRVFAEILLRLVEETLDRPGLAEVEEELIELGLLSYCREAIKKRRPA